MKTLLIMRHAKSSWDNPAHADHDRPLNKRGKRDAPRMGELIDEVGLTPDFIVSSTAVRARKTAEIVAKNCGYNGEIQLEGELYHATPAAFFDVLARLRENYAGVLAVGHNPGISEFVSQLAGEDESMPTAALAHIRVEIDAWDQFDRSCQAELIQLWRPKELDD